MGNYKKGIFLLFILCNVFVLYSCSNEVQQQGETETKEIISERESNEEENNREVEFGQYYETESSIGKQCDYVLGEGRDGEDYYQLVANEEEDYDGVKIEVGVIKNNEWLLQPTSKMPLVDKDKTLYGSDIAGLDDVPDGIYYMGFGCFLYRARTKGYSSTYEEIIYNVNNQKYYEHKGRNDNEIIVSSPRPLNYTTPVDFEENWEIKSENIIVDTIDYEDKSVYKILNLSTMNTREIDFRIPDEIKSGDQFRTVHPISRGIFAIAGEHRGCAFYNITGKLLFTISYEKIPREYLYDPIIFKGKYCTFTVENNKGTLFDITVNKKGKVIDSEGIDE